MQTYPCGHRVVCRKCFVKTIQAAVSQRCLPLKCVVCRTRILKLKQSGDDTPLTPTLGHKRLQESPHRQSGSSAVSAANGSSGSSSHGLPKPVLLAKQLFTGHRHSSSGSGSHHQPSPSRQGATARAGSGGTSRHGVSSQGQPVVTTKLMQPWLIYPSQSSPKQQHAFTNDTLGDVRGRSHGAGAESARSHSTPRDCRVRGEPLPRSQGPFSPSHRRPRHQCDPVTSSRVAELKHGHMLSPRVPRCSQCIDQRPPQMNQAV